MSDLKVASCFCVFVYDTGEMQMVDATPKCVETMNNIGDEEKQESWENYTELFQDTSKVSSKAGVEITKVKGG